MNTTGGKPLKFIPAQQNGRLMFTGQPGLFFHDGNRPGQLAGSFPQPPAGLIAGEWVREWLGADECDRR